MIGAKKFTWNTCCQTSSAVSIEPSRLPPSALGEIAALLTSACSSPFSSRCLISAIAASRVRRVGEIDLDVILRPHLPRAVLREGVARAGDHAPAGGREALHRRMADAAARAGEQQRAARLVVVRSRHVSSSQALHASSRIQPRLGPRLAPAARGGIRRGRAGGTAGRARTRSISGTMR